MKAHKNGKGARFTKIFGFKKLLYSEDLPTRVEALKRESFIKTWPREKKLLLALGDTKGTPVPRKERLQNHIDIKKLVKDVNKQVTQLCETENQIVMKIADYVHHTTLKSIEPGVEIVDSLEKIINETLDHALKQNCDFVIIIKGLILGAFRSSKSVSQEAHKTIDHIIDIIIKKSFKLNIDVGILVQGILEGVYQISKEHEFNLEVSLSETATDMVFSAKLISEEFGEQIIRAIPKIYKGYNVIIRKK